MSHTVWPLSKTLAKYIDICEKTKRDSVLVFAYQNREIDFQKMDYSTVWLFWKVDFSVAERKWAPRLHESITFARNVVWCRRGGQKAWATMGQALGAKSFT